MAAMTAPQSVIGFVLLMTFIDPLVALIPRGSGWQSWQDDFFRIGGQCPRPPQPPEGRATINAVNDTLVVDYSCHGNHHVLGPEQLLCDKSSGRWVKNGSYGDQWPVCSLCPEGWLGAQGSCYRLVVNSFRADWRVTWQQAQEKCQTWNSSLAEIPNQAVEELLENIIGGSSAGNRYVRDKNGNRVTIHTAYRGTWVGLTDTVVPGVLTWAFSNRSWTEVGYAPPGVNVNAPSPTFPDLESYCLRLRAGSPNIIWEFGYCEAILSAALCQKRAYVTCGDPGLPSNADRVMSQLDQHVVYSCKRGYRRQGPAEYRCNTLNGVWMSNGNPLTANTSTCVEITCPAPVFGGKHVVMMSSGGKPSPAAEYGYGTVLDFECESDLFVTDVRIRGNHTVHCTHSGTWSDAVFGCKKVLCPVPTVHGHHVNTTLFSHVTNFTRHDTITFRCRHGYHVVGGADAYAESVECLHNGSWSGSIMKCKKCSCSGDHTNACDWRTGRCVCKNPNGATGGNCSECVARSYRTSASDPCLSCGCVLSGVEDVVPGEDKGECDSASGQCRCKCGCTGRTCSQCKLTCPAELNYTTGLAGRGSLDWVTATPGDVIATRCMYGGGVATRACGCHGASSTLRWMAADISQCKVNPDPIAALNALLNVPVTVENGAELSGALSDITTESTRIEGRTVDLSNQVIANIIDVPTSDKTVGEGIIGTLSNIGNVNSTVLAEGNKESDTSNRLLLLGEKYAATTLLLPDEVRLIQTDNLALEVTDVRAENLSSLVLDADSAGSSRKRRATEKATQQPKAKISFANVRNLKTNSSNDVRVQFAVFTSASLFHRDIDASGKPSPSPSTELGGTTTARHSLNSVVASSKIGRGKTSFDGEVRLDFKLDREGLQPICVYWDFLLNDGQGGWSRRGCRVVFAGNDTSVLSSNTTVQCHCSHLTHFAVLMDLDPERQASAAHLQALSYITYIGCGLSMLALLIAIVLLLAFKRLRQAVQMKLLLHLCIAWFLALLSFIVGGEVTSSHAACQSLAVVTHYFLLVVFAFSFMQAYYLYSSLVKVYGNLTKKFMWKCVALGWGVPALIVAITMGATVMDAYEPSDTGKVVCLINIAQHKIAFIVSFYVPIGLVLLANIIIFILVLRRIIKPRPGMRQRDLQDHKRDLKLSVSLALLLGLTWLFGMSLAGEVKLVFEYVFTALNAFAGVFIVAMHFGLRKEVHEELSRSWSQVSTNRSFMSASRSSTKSNGLGKTGKSFDGDHHQHPGLTSMSSSSSMKKSRQYIDSGAAPSSTSPTHQLDDVETPSGSKRPSVNSTGEEPPPYSPNGKPKDGDASPPTDAAEGATDIPEVESPYKNGAAKAMAAEMGEKSDSLDNRQAPRLERNTSELSTTAGRVIVFPEAAEVQDVDV